MSEKPKGVTVMLSGDRQMYVPKWPAMVAGANIAKAGKVLGVEYLEDICNGNMKALTLCLGESDHPDELANFLRYLVCCVGLEGEGCQEREFNSKFAGDFALVVEMSCRILQVHFAELFGLGLGEARSPLNIVQEA